MILQGAKYASTLDISFPRHFTLAKPLPRLQFIFGIIKLKSYQGSIFHF